MCVREHVCVHMGACYGEEVGSWDAVTPRTSLEDVVEDDPPVQTVEIHPGPPGMPAA